MAHVAPRRCIGEAIPLRLALILTFLLLTVASILLPVASIGDDETTRAEILVGMSTALSGPAADLGRNMRDGVLAAFDEQNRAGGIHGRPLRLLALDDGYEPSRTAPNMRTLIEDHDVAAVLGNVGTPTAIAALPIALQGKTPFVGAFTGAGVLRKTPPDRYVINFRASYAQETAAMVDALITQAGLDPQEIAFFTQRDGYGDAGYSGGIAALKAHGLDEIDRVLHVRYERNTTAVESAVSEILLAEPTPRAVIMVGAYAPCARFIRLTRDTGLDLMFLNVSFVGSRSLAHALGDSADGVIVTQVVPPLGSEAPILDEYVDALRQSNPRARPSFGSLEGYVAARIFCRALGAIEGPPTRETIIDALESLGQFDIGLGAPLSLAPDDHQACHRVWPTVLRDGDVVPFDWKSLAPQQEALRSR